MRILFVCTGNICRSPIAEYLLRELINHSDTMPGTLPEFSIASAGVFGLSGHPMDPRSLEYLRQRGIDGSSFTARRISRKILRESDVIIGFEPMHITECLAVFPVAWPRTFRLSELAQWHRSGTLKSLGELPLLRRHLASVHQEIPDPVQFNDIEKYYRTLDAITQEITALATLLPAGE